MVGWEVDGFATKPISTIVDVGFCGGGGIRPLLAFDLDDATGLEIAISDAFACVLGAGALRLMTLEAE